MIDFCPLCVFKSLIKALAQEDAKSHWLHLFGLSPITLPPEQIQPQVYVTYLDSIVSGKVHKNLWFPKKSKYFLGSLVKKCSFLCFFYPFLPGPTGIKELRTRCCPERPQMTLKHFPWVYYMIICHVGPHWGHSGTHGDPKMAQNSTEMA